MTGAAATEIGGSTTASEFQYLRKKSHATIEDIQKYEDTRLSIIDKISFAAYIKTLGTICNNLQMFTECYSQLYGKHALGFLGDFSQLECIGGDSIYLHKDGLYWEQALNCMVELKGNHQYSKCKRLQEIMCKMREGQLSEENRKILNSRVIDGESVKMPNLMEVQFATFFNNKRAQINADVFKLYLEKYHKDATKDSIPLSGIVIKAKAKWNGYDRELSFDQRKVLFEECSESDCKNSQQQ